VHLLAGAADHEGDALPDLPGPQKAPDEDPLGPGWIARVEHHRVGEPGHAALG
jgi:hypothetical protein